MKSNKFLHLLGLTIAALSLSSCGDSPVTPAFECDASEMRLNYYSIGLVADEEKQIVANFSPKAAYYHKPTFVSSNPDVAKVDENGNIKAKKAGLATITVSVNEGDAKISEEVRVFVGEKETGTSVLSDNVNKQLAYQAKFVKDGSAEVTEVHEIRNTDFFLEGVIQKGAYEDSTYTLSKKDGFIGFGGYESVLKAPEGNRESLHYGWAFLTGEDYISHLYHTYNSNKTRMSIPTQSYMSKGRFQCVSDILDNLFTRGSEIIVDQNLSTALEVSTLKGLRRGTVYTYHDADNDIMIYKESGKGSTTMEPEYESNYEVPAGTKMQAVQDITYCWHNGICVAEDIELDYNYDLSDGHWDRNLTLRFSCKVNDDVDVVLPNNSEYRVVDSIYDL